MTLTLGERRWSPALVLLVLAIVALASRSAAFGDPVNHVDDEFYLLVGKVMLQGGWPYVDIWDRKPVGLFAIYAAIAGVSGAYAVQGVQLVAGLCALATAYVVQRIGRRLSSDWGGLLAGVAYLVCLPMFGGQTGQSPIFYNLLIAGAALLFVQSLETGEQRAVTRRALLAMLWCGLAMTVKQISFIEGGFIGAAFLWRFHRLGLGLPAIAWRAAAMILLALAPTLACLLVYVAAGHGEAFVFANFISIFRKHPVGGLALERGLVVLVRALLPVLLIALWGLWVRRRAQGWTDLNLFIAGWIAAAVAGYLFVPYFFDHYALPLMVPLSISAATLYARPRGWWIAAAIALLSTATGGMVAFEKHAKRIEAARALTAVIDRELRGGCLYLVSGRPYFYDATPTCRMSRFVFPDHLNDNAERDGIGIDQLTEVRRIFANEPTVVVTDVNEDWRRTPSVKAFVDGELARHYRPVFKLPGRTPRNLVSLVIWSRVDEAGKTAPAR
ncbi:hypothetical protein GCM10022281_18870 [Sphingomonas rosea]|uniref:Glycosyltransferase RgtA/B/C/D-like domain-containing protein n=1 Tax=Sphingomonas rosea TaxID=335605 RepID=A0ABP7U9L7_9SPHN